MLWFFKLPQSFNCK